MYSGNMFYSAVVGAMDRGFLYIPYYVGRRESFTICETTVDNWLEKLENF